MIPQEYNRKAEELERLFQEAAPLLIWRVDRWHYGYPLPWYWTVKAEAEILGRGFYAKCTIDGFYLDSEEKRKYLVDRKTDEIVHAMAAFLLGKGEGHNDRP